MRLASIIQLGQRYLILGILLVVILAIGSVVGYFGIYKKVLKGKKKLSKKKACWFAVFICYMTVVLCATMLDRSNVWIHGTILPLFYSYKEAWNSFTAADWRNIILNILLFVPFGFLLPVGVKWFRNFMKTYLAGLILTVCIEVLQLVLKRGIFELDDIFNNTLGTMIGYGCYVLLISLISVIRKKNVYNQGSSSDVWNYSS